MSQAVRQIVRHLVYTSSLLIIMLRFICSKGKFLQLFNIMNMIVGSNKEVLYLRLNEHHLSAYFGTNISVVKSMVSGTRGVSL